MYTKNIWLLLFTTLLIPVSCEKAPIGHTETCTWTPGTAHPKAAVFQAVLDEYARKGLPGITALVRDGNGVWVGAAGKATAIDASTCLVAALNTETKTFVEHPAR